MVRRPFSFSVFEAMNRVCNSLESPTTRDAGLPRLEPGQTQTRLAVKPRPTGAQSRLRRASARVFDESCEWRPPSASADRQPLPQQCLLFPQTSGGESQRLKLIVTKMTANRSLALPEAIPLCTRRSSMSRKPDYRASTPAYHAWQVSTYPLARFALPQSKSF